MKLKKADSLNYKCDKCGRYRFHKDMINDDWCYQCDEEVQLIGNNRNGESK